MQTGDKVMDAVAQFFPDVVLLDVNMPGKNGLDICREIKIKWPNIKTMLLTMYMPSDVGLQAETQPADAYVLKNSGSEILLTALTEILSGNRFYDPAIRTINNHSNDHFANKLKLSSREKEILQLIIAGSSNKEIATTLFLSELTIKTHRKNIMSKMGAHNLAELLRKSL